MLSLLSLLLASGTVLRADTERWTPQTYPMPRRNHTACNTWENSTLCDPDHILTDQWRAQINENIQRQMQRLTEADVPLAEKAPTLECANRTEGVTIFVVLAKRIFTPNNQNITGNDLTNFGDELVKQYGLNDLPCKTFLLLIGIEAAKLAYVRTGKDLCLPADLMQRVFHQYKLFNAKNFQAGLNKIVDEIGEQMADPFKDQTTTTTAGGGGGGGIGNGDSGGGNTSRSGQQNSTSTSPTTLAEIVAALSEREEQMRRQGKAGTYTTASAATAAELIDGEVWGQKRKQHDGEDEQQHGQRGGAVLWLMFLLLGAAILVSFGSLALLTVVQRRHHQQWRRQQQQMAKRSKWMMQTVLASNANGNGKGQQQLRLVPDNLMIVTIGSGDVAELGKKAPRRGINNDNVNDDNADRMDQKQQAIVVNGMERRNGIGNEADKGDDDVADDMMRERKRRTTTEKATTRTERKTNDGIDANNSRGQQIQVMVMEVNGSEEGDSDAGANDVENDDNKENNNNNNSSRNREEMNQLMKNATGKVGKTGSERHKPQHECQRKLADYNNNNNDPSEEEEEEWDEEEDKKEVERDSTSANAVAALNGNGTISTPQKQPKQRVVRIGAAELETDLVIGAGIYGGIGEWHRRDGKGKNGEGEGGGDEQ